MSKAKVPNLNLPFLVSYVLVYLLLLYIPMFVWFSNKLFKRLEHNFQSPREYVKKIEIGKKTRARTHVQTHTHTHTHTRNTIILQIL